MKALLTSNGITNPSITDALVGLLGRPIADANALFVPTGVYPFPGGAYAAGRAVQGRLGGPLAGLGWKSLGILELTALASLERDAWVPTVRDADALLVWGGDPLFLAHWFRRCGLSDLLPELSAVYVGVSAGAMLAGPRIVETYPGRPPNVPEAQVLDEVRFETADGPADRILVAGAGLGLVDFAIIPHLNHPDHPDASTVNAERWAARNAAPTYAIDDQTAVQVVDGQLDVVSEGSWHLFAAGPTS